jgi:hypothetical protein
MVPAPLDPAVQDDFPAHMGAGQLTATMRPDFHATFAFFIGRKHSVEKFFLIVLKTPKIMLPGRDPSSLCSNGPILHV